MDDVVAGRWKRTREIEVSLGVSVHEVTHVSTRRRGALVTPVRESSSYAAARRRVQRETEALARVQHPCVVDLHDAGAANGSPFLVRELVEGRTLEGLLVTRGQLSVELVTVIGAQAAAALAAAHEQGVVHRDLHPGNLQIARCVDGAERVRLLGFDQALFDVDPDDLNDHVDGVLDPDYTAPELLAHAQAATMRSDVYALGAVLWACLSGKPPRRAGEAAAGGGTDAADDEPPSSRSLPRGTPAELGDALLHALAPTPEERIEDARSFASMLAAVVTAVAPARTASLPPSERTSRRPTAPPPLVAEPPPGESSRRREPRASYATPVSISLGGRMVDGRTEDVSEHGMLVVLRDRLEPGTECAVRFALPIEGRIVTCPAVVRWTRGTAGACAIGLELVQPAQTTTLSIARYVALMGQPP